MMNEGGRQELKQTTLIVGLGKTGLSVAHYLNQEGVVFAVADSRMQPPGLTELIEHYPHCQRWLGEFDESLFTSVQRLVVSPGIAIKATPALVAAQKKGIEIIGDVELFVRAVDTPIIAITGSNGKTTLTTLLYEMGNHSNITTQMVGNVGIPCLDQLLDTALVVPAQIELYIVELSSFQLETTPSLNALAAVVLNICDDHLDRYIDLDDYANTKAEIYKGARYCVFNRDDEHVVQLVNKAHSQSSELVSFGLNQSNEGHWGLLVDQQGKEWIAKGQQAICPVEGIKLFGRHNLANLLAAFALGELANIKRSSMVAIAQSFGGVIHRTQWLMTRNGVHWFNDSKGTNVGASVAALFGMPNLSVLIAGGQGKGADFSPLASAIREKARAVVLMGEDAHLIEAQLDDAMPRVYVSSMDEAVLIASQWAKKGDNVLLSPACASFDMFANYAERGLKFIECVEKLNHD